MIKILSNKYWIQWSKKTGESSTFPVSAGRPPWRTGTDSFPPTWHLKTSITMFEVRLPWIPSSICGEVTSSGGIMRLAQTSLEVWRLALVWVHRLGCRSPVVWWTLSISCMTGTWRQIPLVRSWMTPPFTSFRRNSFSLDMLCVHDWVCVREKEKQKEHNRENAHQKLVTCCV